MIANSRREVKEAKEGKDIFDGDDSQIVINSEINLKKNDELQLNEGKSSITHQGGNNPQGNNKKLDIIDEETKNHIDDMKKGTYNIMVAVRCRPLWNKEREFNDSEIVKILDKKMVILMDPYEYNGPTDVFKNRSREQNYAFDYAFDKTCSQV